MKSKTTKIIAIITIVCLLIIIVACTIFDVVKNNKNATDNPSNDNTSSGSIDNSGEVLPSGSIDSGNLPSGSISSGDVNSGDVSGGEELPSGTIVIDGNNQIPPIQEDEDVDYSKAFIVDGSMLTGLTDYGKTLQRIVIPDGVTEIGNDVFANNRNVISIELPDGLKSIGEYAFCYCMNLSYINMPKSIENIGEGAFAFCCNLTSLELPIDVSEGVFEACFNLVIRCPESQLQNAPYYFSTGNDDQYRIPVVYNCNDNEIADDGYIYVLANDGVQYALKDGIAKVTGSRYISGDIEVASKVIYKGKTYTVTEIDSFAFSSCFYVKNIVLPNTVTKIKTGVFISCPTLSSIVIPSSVVSVESGIITGGSSTSLTIYCEASNKPSGWDDNWKEDIRTNPPVIWDYKNNDKADNDYIYFVADNGIKYALKDEQATAVGSGKMINGDLIIPEFVEYKGIKYTVTSIGESAFCLSDIKSVSIPRSVTSIGKGAFESCDRLKSVSIPGGVKDIGSSAFYKCSSLTSVELQSGVESIGSDAFYGCSNLTSIVIPISVSSIKESLFDGCSNLTIYCEAESMPSGWNWWWNINKLPVVWGYKVS